MAPAPEAKRLAHDPPHDPAGISPNG